MTDEHKATTSASSKQADSTIKSVASDIKAATNQKFDEAVKEVRTQADGAKADAANEVNDVATSLRRASEDMRDGSAQERTLAQIARSLADASDAIRDKDLGEISQDIRKVARDNPVLFLGGAALLGFAASRYAKASGNHANGSDTPSSMTPEAQARDFVGEGNPNTTPAGVET
ncbi:hypothetical protein [Roseovarius nitratireducens]|uniref:hypothetical protein n=1 Tax=Roseovarius nitratireducens TaxID=2044597 RepID=UPI000CE1E355|nr:hypothetical protein [Roseovarius nitratireducens]